MVACNVRLSMRVIVRPVHLFKMDHGLESPVPKSNTRKLVFEPLGNISLKIAMCGATVMFALVAPEGLSAWYSIVSMAGSPLIEARQSSLSGFATIEFTHG